MPPRVPGASAPLAAALGQRSSATAVRGFCTTQPVERMSRNRVRMWQWMKRHGKPMFEESGRDRRYMGQAEDQPFPLNPHFKSEPVLSDTVREAIWERVVENGEAIKSVSYEYGVDVRRIAAVVRLKQVEKAMISKEEPLAAPYAHAIGRMVPQAQLDDLQDPNRPFEPINEVPMHPYTMQQLFVPVSESRHFTREDAAKAFHDHLLPADERSFQKELIAAEREVVQGVPRGEAMEKYKLEVQRLEEEHARKMAERKQAEADRMMTIETGRAAYRIKDIKVEDRGHDGKSPRGVGWRYGAPHQDRKRGLVKIPTQVP